ncbi:MAG: DEAD/DEAH box helicase [Myxococcota bacterium]
MTLHRDADRVGLLLWVPEDQDVPPVLRSSFLRGRWRTDVPVVMPDRAGRPERVTVDGWFLKASTAAAALAPMSLNTVDDLPASIAVWALASKWAVEAVVRQQAVPSLTPTDDPDRYEARWRVAPVRAEDRSRLTGLASAMPGVARAGVNGDEHVPTPLAALRTFLDAAVDGLLRAATEETAPHPASGPSWAMRLGRALSGPDPSFPIQGLSDRHLPGSLDRWIAPTTAIGGTRPLVGFRLEEPASAQGHWRVTYHLLEAGGEERVAVADLRDGVPSARDLAARMSRPGETLLEALARCARVFEPIERSLSGRLPGGVMLDASEAWSFLTDAALRLQRAGYWVDVPAALSRVGRRRVRPRMRLGTDEGGRAAGTGLVGGTVNFRWEASLGDDTLTAKEFRELAQSKAPLVMHRGRWVAVDPAEIERLERLMDKGGGEMAAAEALRLALASEVSVPGGEEASADVVGDGSLAEALEILQAGVDARDAEMEAPVGLVGTLRPYQERGLGWLMDVCGTGFGACLADDMGLGKTIQVLAMMQHMAETEEGRRFLVVCPTSVLGNWRREVQRFTPGLEPVIHHGPSRVEDAETLIELMEDLEEDDADGTVVITSYALARRDLQMFRRIPFDLVALDEAQNIKNPEAGQSRAVRELAARRRVALTGTPVENRLLELWSIMDFLNPGLLGSRNSFKKTFAIPVERYGERDAADRLRRVTAPFILRRLKTDPTIAPDLPDKFEMVRYCPLTREQAALYQVTLDKAMEEISGLEPGIERRGRVLAMLTALKQICNHPAQYLADDGVEPRRSGKLVRFLELLDEVLEGGGHPLVFSQYREMGGILARVVERHVGERVPFFHGGLNRTARDRMVASFQDPHGPPVMIVSLKAGGTGLNLTRANHVFHYDRWWNPAVEDQATDRAFRIGQTRDVTVHRMVSQGTLEEQIHQVLADKRMLADRVVGAGETWLSELDDATLRDLVGLGQDAVLEEDA